MMKPYHATRARGSENAFDHKRGLSFFALKTPIILLAPAKPIARPRLLLRPLFRLRMAASNPVKPNQTTNTMFYYRRVILFITLIRANPTKSDLKVLEHAIPTAIPNLRVFVPLLFKIRVSQTKSNRQHPVIRPYPTKSDHTVYRAPKSRSTRREQSQTHPHLNRIAKPRFGS